MELDLTPRDIPRTYPGRDAARKFCVNVRVTQRHRLAAEQLVAEMKVPLASVVEQAIEALAARRATSASI
jgi:hypothetical protein